MVGTPEGWLSAIALQLLLSFSFRSARILAVVAVLASVRGSIARLHARGDLLGSGIVRVSAVEIGLAGLTDLIGVRLLATCGAIRSTGRVSFFGHCILHGAGAAKENGAYRA